MREIGIALLGLGNVGAGVIKLLADNAPQIEARLGARLCIRTIVVRDQDKPRLVDVPAALLSSDVAAAVARADVNIVCELIGGTDLATLAITDAIRLGKHVVTANKAVLARRGREIFAAAAHARLDVYFEAAVCGGVPVIRALREGLASDRVEAIFGIVNGTSNYILSTMAATGAPFAQVLAEAQRLGYAEADPTLDVGGGDAAHKLAVLIGLCFDAAVAVDDIATSGIDTIDPHDFALATRFGFVVKSLAVARDHGSAIEAHVHPTLVPKNWLLADVPGAKNALYVHSRGLGASMYYGAGAGMLPTAVAVVSDLIEVSRNLLARAGATPAVPRAFAQHQRALLPTAEVRSRFYLRMRVIDQPGVLGRIMTALGEHQVSVSQVVQDEPTADAPTQVVVITHLARTGDVQAALAAIDALAMVTAPTVMLHIASSQGGAA